MDMNKEGAGLRILLAEDNLFNQQIAALTLQKNGYVVDIATSGRQTIEKWMDGHYDLILMDVEMPDIDGLEATAAIRRMEKQRGGHIPIFAVSAHRRDSYMDKCIAAGMDDYIAKPIKPEDLAEKITGYAAKTTLARPNSAEAGLLFDLSSLRGIFSENEVRELARLFLKRGAEVVGKIDEAITKKDMVSLRLMAHQLKGSSSQMYAEPLTRVAAKMEDLAEHGEIEGAGVLFTEMKAVFEKVTKAMEKEMQG
jgi:CheY-like chemotaxis protein